jgi:hypothetical protein
MQEDKPRKRLPGLEDLQHPLLGDQPTLQLMPGRNARKGGNRLCCVHPSRLLCDWRVLRLPRIWAEISGYSCRGLPTPAALACCLAFGACSRHGFRGWRLPGPQLPDEAPGPRRPLQVQGGQPTQGGPPSHPSCVLVLRTQRRPLLAVHMPSGCCVHAVVSQEVEA